MAKYYGTHSCGHEGCTNIIGPTKNRQWIADNYFSKLCPECWEIQKQEEREKANKEAAEKAKEMELPELTGTEKQVAWANTLRQNLIDNIDKLTSKELNCIHITENEKIDVLEFIMSQTKASWFIDNRTNLILDWIESKLPEIKKMKTAQEEAPILKEIVDESTVHPENEIHPVPVEIKIENNNVYAVFEKNDKFREIVKSLGYEWSGSRWFREITRTNGPASDRAAELGNRLLNEGFPITITDSIIREKAISGKYEPECKRWVLVRATGDYKDWLVAWWDGKDDKLYKRARSLPGSKWSNPGVVIRVEHWKEVLDFGEMYDFEVSNAALKAIDDYKKSLEKATIVKPAEVKEESQKDGLKEILASSDEILEDLKEED